MGKENHQPIDFQDIFKNNPKILASGIPLVERGQKINDLKFSPEATFNPLLPVFNEISHKYLSSLDLFRISPGETNSEVLDRIRGYLDFYQHLLPLDEKMPYQAARRYLHSLYLEKFGQWTAIWALGCRYFSETPELLNKPNLFDIKLEFYEHGIKPVDFKNGQKENFYLHLPIEENGKKFFGCWPPSETGILHYHKAEENCLQRVAFKR